MGLFLSFYGLKKFVYFVCSGGGAVFLFGGTQDECQLAAPKPFSLMCVLFLSAECSLVHWQCYDGKFPPN